MNTKGIVEEHTCKDAICTACYNEGLKVGKECTRKETLKEVLKDINDKIKLLEAKRLKHKEKGHKNNHSKVREYSHRIKDLNKLKNKWLESEVEK